MRRCITHTEEETIALGAALAGELPAGGGAVVALFGELGSGKTRLIQGICQGLGVREHVASPTFTIVNEYRGTHLRVFHFDFYRLKSLAELREIGFDEYLTSGGVCVIEWADRVLELLPAVRIDVHLALGEGEDENTREITVREVAEVPA